jgi:4'-phosphopantetheinyl transferase
VRSPAPRLATGGAQVWWASPGDARPWHEALLDDGERARYAALPTPAGRQRFLVGCALLRLLLAAHLGLPPSRVPLRRDCDRCGGPHGKPRVAAGGVEVSVSHSAERIAVAAAVGAPLGVDVERIGAGLDADGIARRLLTQAESATYRALPPRDRVRSLLTYWTRKEAVLKATGDGLRVSPALLEVSGPDEEPRLLAWPGRPGMPGRTSLHRLTAGPDHVASLAVIGPELTVTERDGRALLLSPLHSGRRDDPWTLTNA